MARFNRICWGLTVPLVCGITLAMAGSDPVRPYKLPPNLLEYFQSRYGPLQENALVSTVQETPDGPSGRLTVDVNGSSSPRAGWTKSGPTRSDARS